MRRLLLLVSALSLLAAGAACSGNEPVPTADEVARRLIDVDTFEGDWTNNAPADAAGAETGVVPEELQDELPRLDICDAAGEDVRQTVHELPWMAFRQLELDVDDPIRPPDDRTGHMVFVQEFLVAGEPDEMTTLFESIRDGTRACLGEIPAGEEGPGFAELFALPSVGDDRDGTLLTVEEAGGWAEWRLYSAMVREGPIFAHLIITDIRAGDDPYFTDAEIGEMVEAAAELL